MDLDNLTETDWFNLLTKLARAYKRRFGRTLALTEELGELYACHLLHLERVEAGNAGYDALDTEGRRVQIKARSPRTGHRVNLAGTVGRFHNWDFDYALLVLLDGDYQPYEIWRAKPQKLQELQDRIRNERRGIRISAFIGVSKRVDLE